MSSNQHGFPRTKPNIVLWGKEVSWAEENLWVFTVHSVIVLTLFFIIFTKHGLYETAAQ